jgi:hypothetical protein
VVTVVSDSQKSQQNGTSQVASTTQSGSLGADTSNIPNSFSQLLDSVRDHSSSSRSLGHRNFTEITTGTVDSDSLFISDTDPVPDPNLDAENFFDAVDAVQQSSSRRTPNPSWEVDLDDLSPVSPSRQLVGDLRASQSETGPRESPRTNKYNFQHNSNPDTEQASPFSRVPIGQFSQNFPSCEQDFSTQLQNNTSNTENPPDAQPQPVPDTFISSSSALTQSEQSTAENQEKAPALGERDLNSHPSTQDREKSNYVSQDPEDKVGRDPEFTPTPIRRQSIENLRTFLLTEGLRSRIPRAQTMDDTNSNVRATPGSGISLKEKLNALRADYNYPIISTSADPSGSATPSGPPTAIPDKPVNNPISTDGPLPLSQRVISTSPPAFVRPMDLRYEDAEMVMQSSQAPEFGREEYAIPIPIETIAKDEYLKLMTKSTQVFDSMLNLSSDVSPAMVSVS